ncbi:MFS transporter [Amycolatopsis sp. NPDC051371]|uniref:MFS transporter n=1 Tax=Amycolatopsis sp. NPDC051371 TaxID=3155800 RepID=UPI00343378AF
MFRTPPAAPPPQAATDARPTTRRPYALLLIALLWPAQLVNASAAITSYAQAEIAQTFHTTQIAWFSIVYALFGTLLLPFAVKISDMYGKRRVMLVLVVCGLAGDVLCAVAPTFGVLVAGRAVSAGYVPVAALAFAAARDVLPARRLATATGVMGATLGAIVAVGPLIAGWLLDAYGFRGAMWFVAAGTAVALLLVATLIPETPRHAAGGTFDSRGGLLLAAGILVLMFGLGQASTLGWADPRVAGGVVGGLLLFALFVRVERRAENPVLDLRMLSRRAVATVVGASALVQGTTFVSLGIMTVVIPLYPRIPGVSDGLGWTALHGALVALPAGLVLFAVGVAASGVMRRTGARTPWLLGVPVAIAGTVLQAFFHYDATQIMVTGIVAALGIGVVYSASPVLVLSAVTVKEQAQANGTAMMLLGLMATVGAQILFSTLGADSNVVQGTTVYRDSAYVHSYLVLAGLLAVGFLVSFFIPDRREEPA